MGIMIEKLGFTCCFCSLSIIETMVDPMNINIMGNYDKYLKKGITLKDMPSQEFYCHFECFKNKIHVSIAGYFIEENFILDDND